MAAGLAPGAHEDLLRAHLRRVVPWQDAEGADARIEEGPALWIGRRDDERPRRVPTGELRDDRRGMLADLLAPGHDHEVEHARACCHVPLFGPVDHRGELGDGPDPGELLLDIRDRMSPRRPAQCRLPRDLWLGRDDQAGCEVGLVRRDGRRARHQIRRQRRPSRVMSSSAAAGPHDPAS